MGAKTACNGSGILDTRVPNSPTNSVTPTPLRKTILSLTLASSILGSRISSGTLIGKKVILISQFADIAVAADVHGNDESQVPSLDFRAMQFSVAADRRRHHGEHDIVHGAANSSGEWP